MRTTRPGGAVAPAGERKLVTVLFVDLTGYTALSASLDPEEVYRFLHPGVLALRRIVERFGGTVPQVMGDGFMAVFGVPVIHEDDAERAVRAALAVRDHVAEMNAGRSGIPFPAVHAGVNSGEVMVAPSPEPSGFAVIGDTVNTASRLADLATGGTILVDERTRGRTAHAVRYGPRRARRAKGKSHAIATFEALGALAGAPGRRGSSSVFVDRRDAIERVREEVRGAERAGRSRVLLVTGEPGTGKSRLAAELGRRRVGHVLLGRCRAFGNQLPLQPLAEAVASGLGLPVGADARAVDAAVRRIRPRAPAPDRGGLGRDLRLLLGTEHGPAGEARASIHDAARAARVAIEVMARERPVIVAIDDLHWADADLMQLLREVERDPWAAPVLFLALSRPGPGLGGLPRIELPLLETEDMRLLARHVLGPSVPEEAVEETLARAAGNPLFLEETLGMLVESGTLSPGEGAWRIADPDGLHRVPSTIRLLIAARLDGLPAREKAVLHGAAVAGEITWDRLVEHLHGTAGVRSALASLQRRGLLVRRQSMLPGAIELELKHGLIRDVAYESVPRGERADLHLAIAEWLRRQANDLPDEPVALLAHHYERAWNLARSRTGPSPAPETAALAVRHLRRWADRTFSYQARLAESIYERALAVARASADAIDASEVADLLIGRAESLIEMGRHGEARADASEARALATKLGDRRRRARALLALGRTESDRGSPARARTLLADARRLFHADGDVRGEAWALHRRSESWSAADYERELHDLEESYRLFTRARDRWGGAIAAQDLAYLLTPRGGPDFRRWFDRASRLAGDEGDLRSRATLTRTAGYAAFYRGDYARAIEEMREAGPLASRSGDRYAEADALLIRALSEGAVGSPDEADRLAEALLRIGRELGSARLHALALLAGARASIRRGDPRVASRRLAAARRLVERRRQALTRVDLYLVDACVRLDRGAFAEVGAIAGRLAGAARRNGWTLWEPLPPLFRGRVALGLGRAEVAVTDLMRAATLARRHGATGTERLALLLAAQSRLLAGATGGGRRARSAEDAEDAESEAISAENRALGALRAGRLDRAREGFEAAASSWEVLGTTVWRARALRMAAETARAARDGRAAAGLARRSEAVVARLGTPASVRTAIRRASADAVSA